MLVLFSFTGREYSIQRKGKRLSEIQNKFLFLLGEQEHFIFSNLAPFLTRPDVTSVLLFENKNSSSLETISSDHPPLKIKSPVLTFSYLVISSSEDKCDKQIPPRPIQGTDQQDSTCA